MFGKLLTTVLVSGLCTFAVRAVEVEPWFGAPIPASGEKPIPDCGMTAARIFDAPISGLERIGSMAIPTTADLPESANASIGFECLDRGLFDPDRCYDPLAAVGVKWARCQTMWSRCEKQKGVYDFTVLDGVVDNLTRRGIRPWFCVSFGNTLYMTNCYTGAAVGCVPTLYGDECRAAWCAYVRALARRYKGKVTHWEIWNEPNLKHFWQPSKPNAIDYLELVKLTGGIIREEIPDAKIGGTTSMPAIQEWETAFFEAGGAALIDFWCGHGYAPAPESIRPKWRIATCDSIDYVTVLKEVRAFIDAHGGKHLEIWQGEAGFASWFPENHQLWVPGICKEGWQSQANQAKWLLRRFITDRRAGIARSSFFQMADISRHYSMATVTKKHPAEHGIVNGWTYKPKMSYWAFGHYNALLATARHDESVAVSLTPAADAGAPTVATTFRTPGDAPLFIYYTAFDFSGNYTGTCYTARCDAKLTLPAALAPKDPVLVDMLRGGVYAVSNRLRLQEGDHVTFSGLPLVDYPLLVADRSQIKMKKGGTSGASAPDSVGRLTVEAPPGGDRVVGFAKKELLRVLKGVEGRIVLREEKDLKPQQWRFRSEADGTLVISGRDGMGIAYGVFTFLEKHAGAAWYAPDTEVLPDLQGWKLPQLDEMGMPAFLDREMYVGNDYMDTTWRLRNKETRRAAFGVGIRPGKPGACHTFAAYTKALKAAHPELFGKRLAANGRVCNTLCLTDPVTRAFVAEEMCRYIEQDAAAAQKAGDPSYAVPSIYEISQDDGGSSGECMCERCKALTEAEGSYSGPMIDFASDVARRVGARHPEVFVQTFAYSYTMKPPKTVKGADNLFVRYCDSHVFDPLLRGTPPGDMLEEWGRHAANISLWGYWRIYTGTPLPMMKRIADIGAELRFVRDCHVKNYFAEDESPLSRSFAMLQHWLFLKLTENPDQDEQALARRFMSAYYGAAARPMTQFRDYLERRQESTFAYLDREFFEKANAWLDEAERLVADDARSLGHVRWERVIVDRGAFLTFADTLKQGYKMDVKAVAARLKANHRALLKGWTALKTGGKTTLERRLKAADDEAMIYANYPVAIPERFAGKTVVDRLSINQVPSAGKLVSDPDAAAGYAFYIPKTKAELPFSFGFYHAASKSLGSVGFKTKADVPQDEKFHLYRLGRSVLLKGFYVWFDPTWRYRCWEQTIGIVPEEWDVWVSAKFTGPAFVEGSTEENRVLFDRVLFVKPDGEPSRESAAGESRHATATHDGAVKPMFDMAAPGAVRPDGWLKEMALAQRNGYTGHMDEVDDQFRRAWCATSCPRGKDMAWNAEPGAWSCEGGAYWFDGLARLAYQLEDEALMRQASNRLDVVLSRMSDRAIGFCWWLDRGDPVQVRELQESGNWLIWVTGMFARPVGAWYEATHDVRAASALAHAFGNGIFGYEKFATTPSGAYAAYRLTGDSRVGEALDAFCERLSKNPAGMPRVFSQYAEPPKTSLEETLFIKRRHQLAIGMPTRHGVIASESLLSVLSCYLWTGNAKWLAAVRGWYGFFDQYMRQPYGVTTMDEEWGYPGPGRGTETCVVAAESWTRINLMAALGEGAWGDDVERAFFNAGMNCVTPDFLAHVYMQQPNRTETSNLSDCSFPGGKDKALGRYDRKHWPLCCTAALNRILPDYVQAMWATSRDGGVVAALYGPCRFGVQVSGGMFEAEEITDYPFSEEITIRIQSAPKNPVPVRLRLPGWCAAPEICLNGARVGYKAEDGFAKVVRPWQRGDEIAVRIPMQPVIETMRDYVTPARSYAYVSYGPLLFAKDVTGADPNTAATDVTMPALSPAAADGIKVVRGRMRKGWNWTMAGAPIRLSVPCEAGPIELVPYGCAKMRISLFPTT